MTNQHSVPAHLCIWWKPQEAYYKGTGSRGEEASEDLLRGSGYCRPKHYSSLILWTPGLRDQGLGFFATRRAKAAVPPPGCAVRTVKAPTIAPSRARRRAGKVTRRFAQLWRGWRWPSNGPWQNNRRSKPQKMRSAIFASKEKENRRRRSSCGGVRAAGIARASFTSSV